MVTLLDHSNRIHEYLLAPSAYPDKPTQIEVKETHISWVYLTDRHAYKQKKPVAFEFLDFSTLDRRKHFCEQEVMLNRRFSPEVYLGVVPVSCDSTGEYRLAPGKDVVEWLVKMRRLDETSTLENLIVSNQLTEQRVEQLSKCLTGFYSTQAPAMAVSDEFLARLRHHVLANCNDLMISLTGAEDSIQFSTNAQLRYLTLESDYFVQRVADGRVVDGHGDLRPDHIYFQWARPLIIDCIEFNSEYRINDVVDELAFLSMECDRLGNHEVGRALLASYLRSGNDDPRPALSTFYKSYRACVRSKVAALRAAQSVGKEKTRPLQRSRGYLELAMRYAVDLGSKLVIMVGGLSGTGKSTLAAALQEPLSANMLQTDVVRKDIFAQDSANGKYTRKGRKRVYDVMIGQMKDALSRSPTLILDGTFSSAEIRNAVCDQATKLGAKVLQIQCECPVKEARRRAVQRLGKSNSDSEATPDLLAAQRKDYEPIANPVPLLAVDTTLGTPSNKEEILARVRDLIRSA